MARTIQHALIIVIFISLSACQEYNLSDIFNECSYLCEDYQAPFDAFCNSLQSDIETKCIFDNMETSLLGIVADYRSYQFTKQYSCNMFAYDLVYIKMGAVRDGCHVAITPIPGKQNELKFDGIGTISVASALACMNENVTDLAETSAVCDMQNLNRYDYEQHTPDTDEDGYLICTKVKTLFFNFVLDGGHVLDIEYDLDRDRSCLPLLNAIQHIYGEINNTPVFSAYTPFLILMLFVVYLLK